MVEAVRGVSYRIGRGETLGVVGESGSGKSVSLMGAFGLLPDNAVRLGGAARFEGRDLGTLSAEERRHLLGNDVAFVFQNPISSLDPVMTIGDQIVEAIRNHDRTVDRRTAVGRAAQLLAHVEIGEPEHRLRQYPHEFSGGMCQRVMIAMALANRPKLLIADEPTTAVDSTIQAQILKLLRDLRAEVSGALILVSHDLGVIAENTNRLVVMYAGEVMETGPTSRVLAEPQHPYTQGLLSCRPTTRGRIALKPIPGQPPSPGAAISGCPFEPRCPVGNGKAECRNQRPQLALSGESLAACHFAGSLAFSPGVPLEAGEKAFPGAEPLFRLESVSVAYPVRGPFWRRKQVHLAVRGVDLEVRPGEALGIVGESGSGKSTLARVMTRLVRPSAGAVCFDNRDVFALAGESLRNFRGRVQIVFQDPLNALNPSLSVGDNAAEPLRLRGISRAERYRRVAERFPEVGLDPAHYDHGVTEMSGGQLQRVGIARALSVDPEILIMDEPVSALDVSVQAQILNLLADLKQRRRLSYVFISHDMSVVRQLCDRVAVMRHGQIVESGPVEEIFAEPKDGYTRNLLSAVPEIRTEATPAASQALDCAARKGARLQ